MNPALERSDPAPGCCRPSQRGITGRTAKLVSHSAPPEIFPPITPARQSPESRFAHRDVGRLLAPVLLAVGLLTVPCSADGLIIRDRSGYRIGTIEPQGEDRFVLRDSDGRRKDTAEICENGDINVRGRSGRRLFLLEQGADDLIVLGRSGRRLGTVEER